ncbi:hypothetical protein HK104_003203 [Borealophlyctis nickersoniae]|nr:hypothetical protein HK104_003203 [Borealophlyctis nickersoniae]
MPVKMSTSMPLAAPQPPLPPTHSLPLELWSRIYALLSPHSPSPFAQTCRLFSKVGRDPHAVAGYLIQCHGVKHAIYHAFLRGALTPKVGRVLLEHQCLLPRFLIQLAVRSTADWFGTDEEEEGKRGKELASSAGFDMDGSSSDEENDIFTASSLWGNTGHYRDTRSVAFRQRRRRPKMSSKTFSWLVKVGLELYSECADYAGDDAKSFRDLVTNLYDSHAASTVGAQQPFLLQLAGAGFGNVAMTLMGPPAAGVGGGAAGAGAGIPSDAALVPEDKTDTHVALRKLILHYKYFPVRYSGLGYIPGDGVRSQTPYRRCLFDSGWMSDFHEGASFVLIHTPSKITVLYRLATVDMSLLDALVNQNGFDLATVNDELMKWVLRRESATVAASLQKYLDHGFKLTEPVILLALQLSRPDVIEALRDLVDEDQLRVFIRSLNFNQVVNVIIQCPFQNLAEVTVSELLGPSRLCATESLLTDLRATFSLTDSIFATALLVPETPEQPRRPGSPATRCYPQQHPATAWRWCLRTFGPTHYLTERCFDDVLRKLASGEAHCCLRTLPDTFIRAGVKMEPRHIRFLARMAAHEETVGVGRNLLERIRERVVGNVGEGGEWEGVTWEERKIWAKSITAVLDDEALKSLVCRVNSFTSPAPSSSSSSSSASSDLVNAFRPSSRPFDSDGDVIMTIEEDEDVARATAKARAFWKELEDLKVDVQTRRSKRLKLLRRGAGR